MQEAEKVLVGDDAGIAPTFFQNPAAGVTQDNVKGIVRHGIGLVHFDLAGPILPGFRLALNVAQ